MMNPYIKEHLATGKFRRILLDKLSQTPCKAPFPARQ